MAAAVPVTNQSTAAPVGAVISVDEEEEIVNVLCVIPACFVFRLPTRTSSAEYRAESFKDSQVWSGRLRIQATGKQCEIQLLEDDGKVFANALIMAGERGESNSASAVTKCPDSSRYFVLRVQNQQGKRAMIGLGFADRSEAFDFNVALQDWHNKYKDGGQREQEVKTAKEFVQTGKDMSLQQGQSIKISFKTGGKTESKTNNNPTNVEVGATQTVPPAPPVLSTEGATTSVPVGLATFSGASGTGVAGAGAGADVGGAGVADATAAAAAAAAATSVAGVAGAAGAGVGAGAVDMNNIVDLSIGASLPATTEIALAAGVSGLGIAPPPPSGGRRRRQRK